MLPTYRCDWFNKGLAIFSWASPRCLVPPAQFCTPCPSLLLMWPFCGALAGLFQELWAEKRYVPLFPTFHQQKGLSNSFQIRRPGGDTQHLWTFPLCGPEAGRALGLLSDEKRPPSSPLQRPTGTFVTNPTPREG